MTIQTKYDIGQQVYFELDNEWWTGRIDSFRITNDRIYYEISNIPGYLMGFARKEEHQVQVEKPEGFDKILEFLNLFPEFDDYEKEELTKLVRLLKARADKRKVVA